MHCAGSTIISMLSFLLLCPDFSNDVVAYKMQVDLCLWDACPVRRWLRQFCWLLPLQSCNFLCSFARIARTGSVKSLSTWFHNRHRRFIIDVANRNLAWQSFVIFIRKLQKLFSSCGFFAVVSFCFEVSCWTDGFGWTCWYFELLIWNCFVSLHSVSLGFHSSPHCSLFCFVFVRKLGCNRFALRQLMFFSTYHLLTCFSSFHSLRRLWRRWFASWHGGSWNIWFRRARSPGNSVFVFSFSASLCFFIFTWLFFAPCTSLLLLQLPLFLSSPLPSLFPLFVFQGCETLTDESSALSPFFLVFYFLFLFPTAYFLYLLFAFSSLPSFLFRFLLRVHLLRWHSLVEAFGQHASVRGWSRRSFIQAFERDSLCGLLPWVVVVSSVGWPCSSLIFSLHPTRWPSVFSFSL